MREYREYKGKYIGPGCYSTKAEIDQTIKESKIDYMKILVEVFAATGNRAAAVALADYQERLVNEYGYSWEELEAIEAEIYKAS